MKKSAKVLGFLGTLAIFGSLLCAHGAPTHVIEAEAVSGYYVPKIVDFACGEYHNLAIDSNGNIWQWGGQTGTQTIPQRITGGNRFTKVAAGNDYSVALDAAGNAYAWKNYETPSTLGSGYDSIGVVSHDRAFLSSTSQKAVSYVPHTSEYPFLFLDSNGGLDESQRTSSSVPVIFCGKEAVALGTKYVPSSSSGTNRDYRFTLLDGGKSEDGFSITGVFVRNYSVPNIQPGLSSVTYAGGNLLSVSTPSEGLFVDFAISKAEINDAYSLDKSAGFALKSDGTLYSFGYNYSATNILGSVSTLSIDGQVNEPKQVELEKKALRVDAGASHAIALCEDGNLYAWGSNSYGQLGLGDRTSRTLPAKIPFFESNTQYSFVAAKGETHEGSFAIEGMTSYVEESSPTEGSLVLDSSSGQFSYTPNEDSTGSDRFTIQASDGVATVTYIVNVTIDYKPTWQPSESSFVMRGGESISSGSPAVDSDGDPLKFSIVQYPTKGMVEIDETSGVFTYVANEDGAGDDPFKIGVSDGYFLVEKTINIHIETPLVVSDTYERCFDTTASPIHLDGQLIASDADGDSLTWSIVRQPSLGELVLDSSTGNYTYDVDQGKTGEDSFVLQVTDGVEPVQKEYQIHLYSIEDYGTDLVNVTTTGLPFSSKILTNSKNTTPSYSIKTQGEFGDVTIDPLTGSYTYTPQQNTRGQDSFVVTVSHTYGSYDLEIFVYQNSIPNHSLVETNIVVPEGGSYSGSASCSDLDDSDALIYTLKDNPMKGSVVVNPSTGAYTYVPLAGLAGNDSFSVKVNDGFNEIVIVISAHIESTIETESNIYRTTSQSVLMEGILASLDKDGDILSYSLKNGASNGVVSVFSDGSYSYIPNPDFFGDDSFVASVTDGVNPVDITVHIRVNRKPIAVNETIFAVAKGSAIAGDASASDPDDDPLTYVIFQQAKKGTATIDSTNGNYSYLPSENAAGNDDFVIKVFDGVDYALVTVNVHNETELIIDDSASSLIVGKGKTIEGAVAATDADGDQLSYSVSSAPAKGNLELNSQSGGWVYHCNADAQGSDSFEIAVTDGVKEKTISYDISINTPPRIDGTAELFLTTNQGVSCDGALPGLDAEGDVLAYSVISQGEKGLASIDSVSGHYRYTPNPGEAGNDSFVLSVSDGTTEIEATVSVHIETDIVLEGPPQNIDVAKGGMANGVILANDADGDELSFAIAQQGEKGFASIAQNGAYSYQANGSGAGSDSFVVSVTDGTHVKTVTVFVWVDSTPSFETDSQTVDVAANGRTHGTAIASDLDGDQLSYSIETQPTRGTALVNSKTGEYEYINSASGSSDSFTIKAEDSHGNPACFTVNVRINNAPVVSSLALSVKQGKSVEGQVGVQDPEDDVLSYTISSQGSKGFASIDGTSGRIVYVANKGESGIDTFLVDVCDGINHSKVLITVTIEGNALPEAETLTLRTGQGKAVSGTILGSDADGDKLSYAISRGPANGTGIIDPNSGYLTYTPDRTFYGNDSINIAISDGLDSRIVQVNVIVAQNQAPDAKKGGSYSVTQGQSCSGTIFASDSEGDTLTYSIATAPKYGSVEIDNVTGEWIYKASASVGGNVDSFTVEISDGFNKRHVVVKVQVETNAGTIVLISGGAVLYTGALIGVPLLIRKFLKRPR